MKYPIKLTPQALRQLHDFEKDEFDLEVALLRQNKEFMAYLDELSQAEATIPLDEVECLLALDYVSLMLECKASALLKDAQR